MASLSSQPPLSSLLGHSRPICVFSSPILLSFQLSLKLPRVRAVKTESEGSDLLRKPIIPAAKDFGGISEEEEKSVKKGGYEEKEGDEWVDWEERILEDTVPLVGFVRMILHSGKYKNGDRLSPDHERTIVDRLLPYHPDCEKKVGCGIDYMTVGYHPDFETSRCLFIVRKDEKWIDFSYWKCIKGLIRKKYPLYADSFILRHFRRQKRI